ncbi:MAG: sugar phosphate isomerase/epimerase [Butyrivibrio sp.]|nr:sugar phosphate isomerase/epimerase [Butyrivibrio sp.]
MKVKEISNTNKILKNHVINSDNTTSKSDSLSVKTGVQQIMIGSLCNNYDDALQVLLNIKEAGYIGIELNDFMIQDASLMVKLMCKFSGMPIGNGGNLDWNSLIEESGLEVISLHTDLNAIENSPSEVAQKAKSFGTDKVVITGMYRFDYSDITEVENLAKRLNEAGKALSEEGIQLLYHNHNCELQKVSEDKTAYDIIIEQTDSKYVNFEFDSYWMTDGGANVTALMKKLGSRMKLWHINDRGCTTSGPYMTPILKENATELGNGNMDLDTLVEIAKTNGVEAVVVETHQNWVNNDPIQSFINSYTYLNNNF